MEVLVKIYFKETGLPTAEVMELPWFELTSEHVGTIELLRAVPGFVVRILKEVDGADIPESEVTVMPERIHPWTVHPYEGLFEIMPAEKAGCNDQRARRDRIEDLFWEEIRRWYLRGLEGG